MHYVHCVKCICATFFLVMIVLCDYSNFPLHIMSQMLLYSSLYIVFHNCGVILYITNHDTDKQMRATEGFVWLQSRSSEWACQNSINRNLYWYWPISILDGRNVTSNENKLSWIILLNKIPFRCKILYTQFFTSAN